MGLEAAAEARREQRELKQKIQALDAASAGPPIAEVGSIGDDSPTFTKICRSSPPSLPQAKPQSMQVDLDQTQPRRASSRSPLLLAGGIVAGSGSRSRQPSEDVACENSWRGSSPASQQHLCPSSVGHNELRRSFGKSEDAMLPRFGSRPPTAENAVGHDVEEG